MEIGDWESVLKTAQKGTAMNFLVHLLEEYEIHSPGTGWQYFRQWKQLYAMKVGQMMDYNDCNDIYNFYQDNLKRMFSLSAPTLRIKTVTNSGDLLALLSFNFAYDHRIFPSERQRLDVAGWYLILAYTGCRPAEVVDGEKNIPSGGCWDELFGSQATLLLKMPVGGNSKDISKVLEFETQSRGCPKTLCYEDIQLMIIRHPETGLDTLTMSIKFRNILTEINVNNHFLEKYIVI